MPLSELLALPYHYYIVIGEFSREAAIDFLQVFANEERLRIKKILDGSDTSFCDEYRRIMFTLNCDIGFYKKPIINRIRKESEAFNLKTVSGSEYNKIVSDFSDRLAYCVAQEVDIAVRRGYSKIGVVIPCNTLAKFLSNILDTLNEMREVKRIFERFGDSVTMPNKVDGVQIEARTVIDVNTEYLRDIENGKALNVLVLGTREAAKEYSLKLKTSNVDLVKLTDFDYDLIIKTILASIEKDEKLISQYKAEITKTIIGPAEERFGNLLVLEACTDFNLGLGVNSLSVFAKGLVDNVYSVLE